LGMVGLKVLRIAQDFRHLVGFAPQVGLSRFQVFDSMD
jgi:hypothetical protein